MVQDAQRRIIVGIIVVAFFTIQGTGFIMQ